MRWVLVLAWAGLTVGRAGADGAAPAPVGENLMVNGGFEEWVDVKLISDYLVHRQDVAGVTRIPADLWPRQWVPFLVPYRTGGPGTAEIAMDETVAHSGKRSVRLTNRSTKNITCVQYTTEYPIGSTETPTPIQPNRHYLLTWWVKGQDVAPGGGGSYLDQVYYVSQSPGGKGHRVTPNWDDQTRAPTGTFDWQQERFDFLTDAGAKFLSFTLELRETTGTLWYDDVELRDLGPGMVVPTF
jgi:hypothetical protein